MKAYSVVFAEFEITANAPNAIVGPYVYEDMASAVERVFDYVKDRVRASHIDYFSEEAASLEIDIFDTVQDDDEPVSEEEFDTICGKLTVYRKVRMVDWYFDFRNDSEMHAFFEIKNHVIGE